MKYSNIAWRYRVEDGGFAYKLQCAFTIDKPYSCPYFALTTDGWLIVFSTYAWDGATKFPDFDWIKTPSAIHDALHNAINAGAIPESENDLIDKELELAINGNPGKRWLMRFRGWYVRLATNHVDEHAGVGPKVYTLTPLKHELSMREYYEITQRK